MNYRIKTSLSLIIFTILALTITCSDKTNEKDYLTELTNKLSNIKSASYYLSTVNSAPGDTTEFSEPHREFIKIYVNPGDTLVGAKSAIYSFDDTTRMLRYYDGLARGHINWDKQYVKIDSFQNQRAPFRLVHYPFYMKVQEIINYSLTTEDSIRTVFKDYGDSIHFSLRVYNQHVYFHIKPIVVDNEYIPEDDISKFDIWINKSDNLPYRMRSSWHHISTFESYSKANLNFTQEKVFIPSDHWPDIFEIQKFEGERREVKLDMEGKIAPDWNLKDINNNPISLTDLKSKVIMIQFTGIGCGPCHQSLPFLKQLVNDYNHKDFEFVSIETWSKNADGIKRYKERNEINYKFLKSNKQVNETYNVTSVPVFYILDENRVIRDVIHGYSKSITDETIIKNINELI